MYRTQNGHKINAGTFFNLSLFLAKRTKQTEYNYTKSKCARAFYTIITVSENAIMDLDFFEHLLMRFKPAKLFNFPQFLSFSHPSFS